MMILIGLVLVFGLVFGGFALSGGKFDVLLHALPFEGMMIVGASGGAFVMASSGARLKMTLASLKRVVTGPRWNSKDYTDLLSLMFELARLHRSKGAVALEGHIEHPGDSDIFNRYPRILKDQESTNLIADAFRLLSMNFDDPHQMEDVLTKKIEAIHHENMIPVHGLSVVADGLPAIGIVAAVLGVIKTMSAVDQPPAILGKMLGGALVGTFLGVFLAYCIVAPVVTRLQDIEEQDLAFSYVIRDVVIAMLHNHPANICVEIGRGTIPPHHRPSFQDTETAQRAIAA
ncbi:flagellar motor stator protein MotA [Marivita sp.]|uniref:flagellar motor stator protein MotA n=1 Tax=Marivita sp. TaxID=2003365 RepID=UPI0025C4BC33|nr:flagellar motor stator protein MotA [Marivita sp.]